ncbi:MAG: hypothetical protein PHZ14_08310 [Sulfuricella sp.]|nr:hypothetical protein [Sulfuricella sp.]
MPNQRRHQDGIHAIFIKDFFENLPIFQMRSRYRINRQGEFPYPQRHAVKHIGIQGKALAIILPLAIRSQNQIDSFAICRAIIPDPLLDAPTLVVQDMQLDRPVIKARQIPEIHAAQKCFVYGRPDRLGKIIYPYPSVMLLRFCYRKGIVNVKAIRNDMHIPLLGQYPCPCTSIRAAIALTQERPESIPRDMETTLKKGRNAKITLVRKGKKQPINPRHILHRDMSRQGGPKQGESGCVRAYRRNRADTRTIIRNPGKPGIPGKRNGHARVDNKNAAPIDRQARTHRPDGIVLHHEIERNGAQTIRNRQALHLGIVHFANDQNNPRAQHTVTRDRINRAPDIRKGGPFRKNANGIASVCL